MLGTENRVFFNSRYTFCRPSDTAVRGGRTNRRTLATHLLPTTSESGSHRRVTGLDEA
jgi:hypothetical protein